MEIDANANKALDDWKVKVELRAKVSSDTFEKDDTEQLMTALDLKKNLKYIVFTIQSEAPLVVICQLLP